MKSPALVLVVVALLAGGFGAWWFASRDAGAPARETAEAASASAVGDPEPLDPSPARERLPAAELPGAPVPGEPLDPSAARVDPWLLCIEVVDDDGAPVVGADVTLWEARRVQPPFDRGGKGYAYSGRHAEPVFELPTDSLGQLQVDLDLECFVVTAAKDGVGRAGEHTFWHSRAREPVRIVVERAIEVRGIVLRADGVPAAGALVEARLAEHSSANIGRGAPPDLAPVTADGEGRFAISPVRQGFAYSLVARLDGERSFRERVPIEGPEPPEVVLRMPGAITLGGVVVDEEGAPVAGASVRTWRAYALRDPDQDADDYETASAETGWDGRFEIAVAQHRRYQVVASLDGFCPNAPVWLEPTAVRPHVEVDLVLRRPVEISGRVVRGDGSPCAGMTVVARPEQGETGSYAAVPNSRDLYGRPDPVETDDAGRFVFSVHPDTTWRLSVRWSPGNRRLFVLAEGVRPGDTDVVIEIDDAELAGCIVHGVVSVEGGVEQPHFAIEIIDYENGEVRSVGQASAEIDGQRFTLTPLALGHEVALRVTPKDDEARRAKNSGPYAPFVYGPFTPDRPELEIEIPLRRWGQLPVRVQDSDGSPAVGVGVGGRDAANPWLLRSAPSADETGAFVLDRLAPGILVLTVFSDDGKLHEERVPVEPGQNAEHLVRLPPVPNRTDGR